MNLRQTVSHHVLNRWSIGHAWLNSSVLFAKMTSREQGRWAGCCGYWARPARHEHRKRAKEPSGFPAVERDDQHDAAVHQIVSKIEHICLCMAPVRCHPAPHALQMMSAIQPHFDLTE